MKLTYKRQNGKVLDCDTENDQSMQVLLDALEQEGNPLFELMRLRRELKSVLLAQPAYSDEARSLEADIAMWISSQHILLKREGIRPCLGERDGILNEALFMSSPAWQGGWQEVVNFMNKPIAALVSKLYLPGLDGEAVFPDLSPKELDRFQRIVDLCIPTTNQRRCYELLRSTFSGVKRLIVHSPITIPEFKELEKEGLDVVMFHPF